MTARRGSSKLSDAEKRWIDSIVRIDVNELLPEEERLKPTRVPKRKLRHNAQSDSAAYPVPDKYWSHNAMQRAKRIADAFAKAHGMK